MPTLSIFGAAIGGAWLMMDLWALLALTGEKPSRKYWLLVWLVVGAAIGLLLCLFGQTGFWILFGLLCLVAAACSFFVWLDNKIMSAVLAVNSTAVAGLLIGSMASYPNRNLLIVLLLIIVAIAGGVAWIGASEIDYTEEKEKKQAIANQKEQDRKAGLAKKDE